jgi:hypothetical protein
MRTPQSLIRPFLKMFLASALLHPPGAVAAPRPLVYSHVQSYAYVTAAPVSRYVNVNVHLRNLGGIATACVVKAGGKSRITGLSAYGEAEVDFDGITNFSSYTVDCRVI